ncbi:MAG: peptidylprolyl isomerase [Candidatus Krumholzibacteriia bacterium]
MMKKSAALVCLLAAVLVAGCGSKEEAATERASTTPPPREAQPEYVTVHHILIAFKGSVPVGGVTRSQEEARELAEEVLKRAKTGEDFAALATEYSADNPPGIYKMANTGVAGDLSQGVYERTGMVKGFGDASFSLAVGEIGMAAYDSTTCKYGWHIIKRLE